MKTSRTTVRKGMPAAGVKVLRIIKDTAAKAKPKAPAVRVRPIGVDFGKGRVETPKPASTEKGGAKVSPNTSAAAAHSLRSALGLRPDPAQDEAASKAMREHTARADWRPLALNAVVIHMKTMASATLAGSCATRSPVGPNSVA